MSSKLIPVREWVQFASLPGGPLFFQHIWPRAPFGMGSHLVVASTPYLAWLPPFLVYAFWAGPKRIWLCLSLNIALLLAYAILLATLREWEHQRFADLIAQCHRDGGWAGVCPAGFPIMDPPPPPGYWEWAAAAYFGALLVLYVALALITRRRSGAAPGDTGTRAGDGTDSTL